MPLKKPLVVITGASSGIGAAIAKRFGKENYRLALIARRKSKLEQVQQEISSPTSIHVLDIRSSEEVANTIHQIENEQGPIDILVNNAGVAFGLEKAQECKLEDWEQCVDINIKGLLYCTHAVLPLMVKQNKGHIINMGSIAGHYPYVGSNVYGASKAFVNQFTLNLKADLFGTNLRVTCIEPGLTAGSEFSTNRFRGDEKRASSIYEGTTPLQADDIAEITFLCSSLPPHVNINNIEVMPVVQAQLGLSIFRK